MLEVSFDKCQGIDAQSASTLAQLPPEIHLGIAMEIDSDETVFAMLRTCKKFFRPYRDYLYERNIRHDNGSLVLKIARSNEVAAFEHLERIAKTMDEGLPGLNRVQFVSSEGRTFIGSSFADRTSCPFKPVVSFTPLHWAAARGHSDTVQWLLNKGAECNALGQTWKDRFRHISRMSRLRGWNHRTAPTGDPCTPLLVAVSGGHLDTSIRLLRAGSVINVDNHGANSRDILKTALIYGHVDLIRYLVVQRGYSSQMSDHVRVAADSQMCTTSLRCLAELGCHIFDGLKRLIRFRRHDAQVLEILHDPAVHLNSSRADDSHPSTNEATALLAVCLNRYELEISTIEASRKLMVFLIESGADVNSPAKDSWHRPCYFLDRALALGNDHGFIAKELIDRGAQVQSPSGELSFVDKYLKGMVLDNRLPHEVAVTRADGSSVAVYKLELLMKHGGGIPRRTINGLDLLESIFQFATSVFNRNYITTDVVLINYATLLKLLLDSGISSEPSGSLNRAHNPRSYLYRALNGRHYEIARVFIQQGGTAFCDRDPIQTIFRHYNEMPEDIRQWIRAADLL